MSVRRAHALLCLSFVLLCALAPALLIRFPEWLGSAYIVLHAALTLLMLTVWRLGLRLDDHVHRRALWAGIAALLVLLPAPALTTHDAERYLWDGAVAHAGHDPYRLAPDAPELASLRAQWPTPAEHAAYPTLYPPAALATFTLSAAFGPQRGPWVWKLTVTLAALATLLLGARLLQQHALLAHLPLLTLSPLLILETGIGAHVDAFCALAVVGVLATLRARRASFAGAVLAFGALFKLLPAFALAPVLVALGARAGLRCALAFLLTLAGGYALALAAGWQPLGSLPLFFEKWRFGSPLYSALESFSAPHAAALAATLALLLFALGAWRARRDVATGVLLALSAPLLFSPVVFPWYLCALVPLLALRPSAWLLAWVSAAPLTYEVLNLFAASGEWSPQTWPLWAVAGAWALAAVAGRTSIKSEPAGMAQGQGTA